MNDEFERPVDKIIREARERGEFNELPGKGKPIQWEDETHVPEDQRMAQRLLKHNNFTLDWIALSQEIDAEWAGIQEDIQRMRRMKQEGRLSDAQWRAAANAACEKIRALNKRVIGYNLRAPNEQLYRRPFPIDPDLQDE